MAPEDDGVSRLNARHDLNELRRLDANVDSPNVDYAGSIDGIHLVRTSGTIERADRHGDGVWSISETQLHLRIHAGNQIAVLYSSDRPQPSSCG